MFQVEHAITFGDIRMGSASDWTRDCLQLVERGCDQRSISLSRYVTKLLQRPNQYLGNVVPGRLRDDDLRHGRVLLGRFANPQAGLGKTCGQKPDNL